MKAKRLLFLVMAICFASGAKAQFYDSADDIYYYLLESKNGKTVSIKDQIVYIFNFDGRKAARLGTDSPQYVQERLQENPDYYAEKVETTKYDLEYSSSSYGTCYKQEYTSRTWDSFAGITWVHNYNNTYEFSSSRSTLTLNKIVKGHMANGTPYTDNDILVFKRVNKSFFKVGRSRTPSGTLYE